MTRKIIFITPNFKEGLFQSIQYKIDFEGL